MANKKPAILTGARAKIKVFDKILAYATDVSYNVTVDTIPIEAMGTMEVVSNEPVSYRVDGTLSVLRYTSNAKDQASGTAADGNSPEKIGGEKSSMSDHFNPKNILFSTTCDLEIIERTGGDGAKDINVIKVSDVRFVRRGAALNKRGVMVDNYAFVGILLDDTDNGVITVASGAMLDLS